MNNQYRDIRLGTDIGGTFTDIVLNVRGQSISTKVLTNQKAPEAGILEGISVVTRKAGIGADEIGMIIHGTTLATNALIERRGAKCAFVTTEGFRDVIEMRTENRFDQYDLNLRLNPPLIERQYRFAVRGRLDANGNELEPLDEASIEGLAQKFDAAGFESVAVGFIHAYADGSHERRARDILAAMLRDVPISLSSEVAPQMREYQRFSTVCANAYIHPRIARYLTNLQKLLAEAGAECPVYMIHSAGGLISIDTAKRFPVRLIESGPAGGAIFAAGAAARFGFDKAVSFDMGGTTAKICLIENGEPGTSREFEVARSHRFCRGSGMPISIPVIDMIEIGAGGGSIVWVDGMARIQIGPQSAGSEPGPASYQRGGTQATVTDADILLGKIDPNNFAGGAIELSASAASAAIERDIGMRLSLDTSTAAFGISEVVDENMSNAARVHAIENGKDISEYVMIAFGGAAPLHASRLCEKLGIKRCLIPPGAGVGSAIGFLQAPFSYEAVATRVVSLSRFDVDAVNDMLADLVASAEGFVRAGTTAQIRLELTAFMRYQGQGWEIPVPLKLQRLKGHDVNVIQRHFEACYRGFFGRTIDVLDDLEIEVVSWSVKATERKRKPNRVQPLAGSDTPLTHIFRQVVDTTSGETLDCRVVARKDLHKGARYSGPLLIVEPETATYVSSRYDAAIQMDHSILLSAKCEAEDG